MSFQLKNFVTANHKTKRNHLKRMIDEKVHCMKVAKNMEKNIGMEIEGMDMEDIDI